MSSFDYLRNVFTFGRVPPFPAIYPENKTPVTFDILEQGWIAAFVTGYLCFMILLPAAVGKEKILYFLRMSITAFIGIVVILCNFGQEWEVGKLKSKMFYKAGTVNEINATVGMKLGLRSVNITLFAKPEDLLGDLRGENINYNERFHWTWDQGRAGFGPFAGQIQREYREAQMKGVPYPILWIAEYFTFDGEGLRFGRYYRHAGWYAHICMWCAFVTWILSAILFKFFIRYGAITLSILGCFKVIAALIWCSHRNFIELAIVFNNDESGTLRTRFGIHWYLAIVVGIICIISGISIGIADVFFHNELCNFFAVDPYGIIDEIYADTAIEIVEPSGDIEMQERNKFEGKRQKTVVYKARGAKKSWKKDQAVEPIWDNAEYFDEKNNPTVDPNYLDIGYQTDGEMYYMPFGNPVQDFHYARNDQSHLQARGQSYHNSNMDIYKEEEEDTFYQDTQIDPSYQNQTQQPNYNQQNFDQYDQQFQQPFDYEAQEMNTDTSINPLPLPPKPRV
ncbi:UNVERIFIED_CONTAM: hypothetical protein RMT77_009482 [Armadillidium vulgare]